MSPSATHLPLTIAWNGCSRSRGTGAQHPWNAHRDEEIRRHRKVPTYDAPFIRWIAAFVVRHHAGDHLPEAVDLLTVVSGTQHRQSARRQTRQRRDRRARALVCEIEVQP